MADKVKIIIKKKKQNVKILIRGKTETASVLKNQGAARLLNQMHSPLKMKQAFIISIFQDQLQLRKVLFSATAYEGYGKLSLHVLSSRRSIF